MKYSVTALALLFSALPITPAHAQTNQPVDALASMTSSSTDELLDADFAAYMLGTRCQKFKRADQCVIAFFDKKDQKTDTHVKAIHYRVLYGKSNGLYIGQDFYSSGKKQSNVYFSRAEAGLLNSWYNNDLMFEGNVKGYTTKGEVYFDNNYRNGVEVETPHSPPPPPVANTNNLPKPPLSPTTP